MAKKKKAGKWQPVLIVRLMEDISIDVLEAERLGDLFRYRGSHMDGETEAELAETIDVVTWIVVPDNRVGKKTMQAAKDLVEREAGWLRLQLAAIFRKGPAAVYDAMHPPEGGSSS